MSRFVDKRMARLPALILLAASLLCCPSAAPAAAEERLGQSLQALVVTTAGWSASDASLRLWERKDIRSPWLPAGESIPAVVGRNGLAWGRGIHPDAAAEGPQKREGDGKAPAGIFRLGPAFGEAPRESLLWVDLPYLQMTRESRCVDDPASALYNLLLVNEGIVPKSWTSSEEMKRTDGQYRLGALIGHNAYPVAAGAGSCIFLHSWKGPSAGTAGCTALSASGLEAILRRLKAGAKPLLIQLPQAEYERLRNPWGLP